MERHDLELTATVGLVGGLTIQFAEGRSPGQIGEGVALWEEGFDLVEPHLRKACPDWTADHRYGVFELSTAARASLVRLLRAAADETPGGSSPEARLLRELAAWLDSRPGDRPISVLGI